MKKKVRSGSPQEIKVTIDGRVVNYNSHAEAARAHNVKPATLSLRLKKGWTIQQALGLYAPPENANTPQKILLDDENAKFASIAVAARQYGIKESVVYPRLHNGWSVKEALGINPHEKSEPIGRTIRVSVSGQEIVFNSISRAARHFGLREGLVLQRISTYGWTPEQALGIVKPPKRAAMPKPIRLGKGTTSVNYKSLMEAVDAYGLNYDVVKQRINKLGWTLEQAFELEAPPKHAKGCLGYIYKVTNTKNKKVYIGQTKTTVDIRWQQHIETALRTIRQKKYSLHGAIKKYGADNFICEALESADSIDKLNRLERRYIAKYRSLDAAYGYNLARGGSGLTGGNKVVVQGVKYDSLASAARAFRVKPQIMHQRINVNGWTIEQALEICPPPEGSSGPKKVVVNEGGRKSAFKSHVAAARHYGVSYKVFHARLHGGWSIEEALEIKKKPKRISEGTSLNVKCKGKLHHYHSIAEASRKFGVDRSLVQSRIQRGWTIEEALEIKKRKGRVFKGTEIKVYHNGKLKHYPSITKAAKDFGLSQSTVSARISKGWSIEEALGIK